MSIPDAAVTSGGSVIVSSGSTTARVGRSRQWLIPVFTFIDRMSSTHIAVDSEPVPAVVGHRDERLELARRHLRRRRSAC